MNRNFGGVEIKPPSGSGMSNKLCPKCNKQELWVSYGCNQELGKLVYFENCHNPSCLYKNDNLTDKDKRVFQIMLKFREVMSKIEEFKLEFAKGDLMEDMLDYEGVKNEIEACLAKGDMESVREILDAYIDAYNKKRKSNE